MNQFMKTTIIFRLTSIIVFSAVILGQESSLYINQDSVLFKEISYADSIVYYDPGALGENTGGEPHKKYQNTNNALGKPDCSAYNDTGFVSLGNGGTLIIKFSDNILVNGPGPDLQIFEVGSDENVNVWVSRDNKIYIPLKKHNDSGYLFNFDVQAEKSYDYRYVKIRDVYDDSIVPDSTDEAAGADIDAVSALNTAKRIVFKTDSIFSSDLIHLSQCGKKKLSEFAINMKTLPGSIILINSYSHQKASEQYLSMLTYMQADIIRKFLFNQQELTEVEYHISGKGYNSTLTQSIIEILIRQK